MIEKHPSTLDTGWLLMESEETPMHVGCLLTFRKPANAGQDYERSLAEKMRAQADVVAPWNYRLRQHRLRRLRASWVEVPDVELDRHFHRLALPHPGGERELGVVVSRLHSNRLDMSRPPWECYLIEGLDEQRFAVYLKLHPVLADELGGMRLLAAWLSGSHRRKASPAPWMRTGGAEGGSEEGREGGREEGAEQCADSSAPAATLDTLAVRGLHTAGAVGRTVGRLLRAGFSRKSALSAPYTAPTSVLNGHISRQRRFATQHYPVARLQRAADLGGTDVNTILLYLIGSALRRFLKEYNALPDAPLLAAVPHSVGDDEAQQQLVDVISPVIVSLGTQYADPHQRLQEVRRSLRAAQQHVDALPDSMLVPYSLTTAAPFLAGQLAGISRWLPAMFNLAVVNMRGPEKALYLNDAKLEAIYPMSALLQGVALNISCVSYAGTLNIGFTGARESLPHLQRIAVYTGLALDALEQRLRAPAREESAHE